MNQELKNPRICLITDSFHPVIGGGETHALLLCREWLRMGVSVSVLTRRIRPDLKREEILDGLTIRRMAPSGFPRFGKYLMTLPTYFELIQRRNEYDIIYVCSFRVAGIPAMLASLRLGKPCVLRAESRGEFSGDFIWNSPEKAIRETPMKPLIRFYLRHRNRLFMKAPAFVSISKDIQKEYQDGGIAGSRIHLIFNGIDTSHFQPVSQEKRLQLRKELNLPVERKVFTYSGKLNRGKGLEMLLRAWKVITEERKDGHLLLVGGGGGQFLSCEKELLDFTEKNGLKNSVTFAGFQTDVQKYLQASDFFVFPSENEALSIALLEALSCELPCLASDISGNRDIVQDELNGRLLPVKNEAAWINAVRDFLKDSSRTVPLGKNGRKRVMDKFSISRVAEEHLTLFRSLASAPGGMEPSLSLLPSVK